MFKGTDVKLPKGYTEATVSGALTDGTTFSSSVKVFNRDASFYTAGQLKGAQQRQLHRETQQNGFAFVTPQTGVQALSAKAVAPRPHAAVAVDYTPVRAATPAPVPQTVKIQRREPVVAGQATAQVSRKMQASINRMVRNTGAVDVTSAAASGQGAGVSPKVQGHINRMVRSAGAVDVTSAVASGAR